MGGIYPKINRKIYYMMLIVFPNLIFAIKCVRMGDRGMVEIWG